MQNSEIIALTVNFIITAFLYMMLPIISIFIDKKGYTKKELLTFVVSNSVLVYAIFFVIHIFKNDGQVPNMYASILYAFLNYGILHKNIKVDKEKTTKDENKISD